MSSIDPAGIKSFLESKNFELTYQDKIALGQKCMGVFSKIVPSAKQNDVFIKKANKKINSCVDASVRELQKQETWVKDVMKVFPKDKMEVLKLHKQMVDILKECHEEYRDNLREHLLAKMKGGAKTLYEGEGGALEVINAFIQVTEVKKMYKAIFGEECSATTLQEVKEQLLEKIGGHEARARGVDVVKIASMPLDKQQEELVTRTVASRREPLTKKLEKSANQVQSLKAEVETLVQKQAELKGQIEGLAQQATALDANLTRLVEERNEVVRSKAECWQEREEKISALAQEIKKESSKIFGNDTKKLESELAKLQQAKKKEQAKIEELDDTLEVGKKSLEDVIKQLLRLNKQQTLVAKEIDSRNAALQDYEFKEKDLQRELNGLENAVKREVSQKPPVTLVQELIAPPVAVVVEPEEREDFEDTEAFDEPVTTALAPELPAAAPSPQANPNQVNPNQAVQSLIDSVSDDISSVSNLLSRLVAPLAVNDDCQLIQTLSSYLSMAVLPTMHAKFEQVQSSPGLLQTVIPLLSEHLASATPGEAPDIRILHALKSVLNDVCNVLATPISNQDSEAPKKSASQELLSKSLPLLDALKANKSKNDKMATALTVASPALSLLGNAFGRSLALGRVVAAVEKKLAPTVLNKAQKKALEQTISELLKKISDSRMLDELKGLVAAMANYLKAKDMSAEAFVQVASPSLIKIAQMIDTHFITPAI